MLKVISQNTKAATDLQETQFHIRQYCGAHDLRIAKGILQLQIF